MRIAVLGLGEAGSLIAGDLVQAGDEVQGYDPAAVPTPDGVTRHLLPGAAVDRCDLVMAVTPGSHARAAIAGVLDSLGNGVVYADLSTGAPHLKREMAGMIESRGGVFADVALMSPVPGRGARAPALASGSGAQRFALLINARGGNVEVVGADAGEAATRKLLRSVVMKGLSALLMESMEAAHLSGKGEWLWDHLVDQLTTVDVALMRRLLVDTPGHAQRRLEEMEAAQALLTELGLPAPMTTATIAHLERLIDEEVADVSQDLA